MVSRTIKSPAPYPRTVTVGLGDVPTSAVLGTQVHILIHSEGSFERSSGQPGLPPLYLRPDTVDSECLPTEEGARGQTPDVGRGKWGTLAP